MRHRSTIDPPLEYEWWCESHGAWHPGNLIDCGLEGYTRDKKERLKEAVPT